MQPWSQFDIIEANGGIRRVLRGGIYASETNIMENVNYQNNAGKLSMRRTLLTLLGAVFAFGILTASYATAEPPDASAATSASAFASTSLR